MNTEETKDKEYANSLYRNIYDSIMKDEVSFESKITLVAFGMTVIFIAYIISKGSGFICLPIGIIGASFLLLCLISDMLSLVIGVMTMRKYANILKEYIEQSIPADLYGIVNKINRIVDAWNQLSAILLFLGMILTAIFIFVNI
ncbi:MAG: hypothetical protein LBK58_08130 [Prevotellaceae bacterium]|jgi:hypothetical protein|nr:hypothetical protein [Prevotellaceae bacterium]